MIPALLLIISAIAYRIVTGLLPSRRERVIELRAARRDCALRAAYFPRKYKFTVPMIALLISDVVHQHFHYGFSLLSPFVLSHYLAFAVVGCLGLLLQNRASIKTLFPASIAGSMIFYIDHECILVALRSGLRQRISPD